MVKCRDVTELASDYLDRGLRPRTRLAMWLHLLACAMCRRYLDQLRETTRLLQAGRLPGASAQTEARLLAEARRKAGA